MSKKFNEHCVGMKLNPEQMVKLGRWLEETNAYSWTVIEGTCHGLGDRAVQLTDNEDYNLFVGAVCTARFLTRSILDTEDVFSFNVIPSKEGDWFIECNECPHCMSQGKDAKETFEMIFDAMHGWLEGGIEDCLKYNKEVM